MLQRQTHEALTRLTLLFMGLLLALAMIPTALHAQEAKAAASDERIGDPYPLTTCPVSGNALGDSPVVKNFEGREIRFCCSDCEEKFKANPAMYLQKVDEQIIKEQKEKYPVADCIVTGEELEAHPIELVAGNRYFALCCKGCVKRVSKDPQKYIDKLNSKVVEKQMSSYPTDVCLVSGEKLGGDMGAPVDYVYDGELVRFCCKGCVKKFEKNPAAYMDKLHALKKAAPSAAAEKPQAAAPTTGKE